MALRNLIFRSYDDRFEGDYSPRWLTVDVENYKKYQNDPLCTYLFSASALADLLYLLSACNRRGFFKKVSTPILLLSGEEDPVGGFGRGVRRVAKRLRRHGKNVEILLYKGFRHELLQDFCQSDVIQKMLSFFEQA